MNTTYFNRDFVGVISAARLIAKQEGVSEGEASDYLSRKLSELGVNIYRIRDGEPYWFLGEAWFSPVVDEVTEVLTCGWWNRPELLECELSAHRFPPTEYAIEWSAAENIFGLKRPHEIAVAEQPQPVESPTGSYGDTANPEIRGASFAKLKRALEQFPQRYDGKSPKLDDDVRPWLRESLACSEREAFVFGAILAEHFDLPAKRG